MSKKFHIKKGDLVQVNAGEDRGKQGKVLEMIPDKQRAIVEGINLVSKHTKPNATHPQGGKPKAKRQESSRWYCEDGSSYSHFQLERGRSGYGKTDKGRT